MHPQSLSWAEGEPWGCWGRFPPPSLGRSHLDPTDLSELMLMKPVASAGS